MTPQHQVVAMRWTSEEVDGGGGQQSDVCDHEAHGIRRHVRAVGYGCVAFAQRRFRTEPESRRAIPSRSASVAWDSYGWQYAE